MLPGMYIRQLTLACDKAIHVLLIIVEGNYVSTSGIICDLLRENQFAPGNDCENPRFKIFNWYNQLLLVLGRLSLVELDTIVYWLSYSVA